MEAFGTLAKYVKRGDEVYICCVSNGDQGHYKIMPKELGEIRKKEDAEASKLNRIIMRCVTFAILDCLNVVKKY